MNRGVTRGGQEDNVGVEMIFYRIFCKIWTKEGEIFKSNSKKVLKIFSNLLVDSTRKMQQKIFHNFFATFQYWRRWSWNMSPMNSPNKYNDPNIENVLCPWKQTYKKMFQRKFLLYFRFSTCRHCENAI